MVPDAMKSPACLPMRPAARPSRRWTVGSSSHTSSPTSARAIASRMAGVGRVSVSERRSTTSCGTGSPGDRQALGGAPSPLGVGVLGGQPAEQRHRLGGPRLPEVHLGEEEERLRDHERMLVVPEDALEPLAGGGGVVLLVVVVVRDDQFFLGEAAAADVDLRQRVRRVAALRVILDELLELRERLPGERLVLLDRLHLVIVAHRETVLDEVGDLVLRVEGQERFELFDRLVELALAEVRLADEEARARRVGGIRVAGHDVLEPAARVLVATPREVLLAETVELFGREDGLRPGAERCAAAEAEERREADRPKPGQV